MPDSAVLKTPVYDVVGVGFGPSNLSLAIALTEYNTEVGPTGAVTAHFLERQPRFGWHRGMLIDDATMQVSFLKDLVTLRNPSSDFSFLSYLHSRGRLVDFINHKTLFPLRVEFHDYFEWAAARVDDLVSYSCEVTGVRPIHADGEIAYFDVQTGDGEVFRARNLVLATGLQPNLPAGFPDSKRIWHNRDLLHRVDSIENTDNSGSGSSPQRFVVVGAGQSAAEVAAFLHTRFADAEVCSVFARYGFSPSDDSPLANRIFDPAAVDHFYAAPENTRQRLMTYHANTNYSVVDLDLIDDLYRRMYQEKVQGIQRLRMFNVSRPAEVVDTGDGVRVTVESLVTGERTVLDADAVVCATGYQPDDTLPLLGELREHCRRDETGRLCVERDYRLRTDPTLRPGVYLQGGGTEHTHGITSSLLSNNAVRSGEILDSIIARRSAGAHSGAEYVTTGSSSR